MILYVLPDEMTDYKQLEFTYAVENFGDSELQIKMDFAQKPYVSVQPDPDYLVIELQEFRDEQG